MAEQKKEGMATVETTNVGGVQVRKYKINDENDTLIKIKSEAEQQRDIEEYEKRQQELADKKAQERTEKFRQQLKADLEAQNFATDEVSLQEAAEKLRIDTADMKEHLAQLKKSDYIFCIGDSITYGFEVEGTQTWIGRLRRQEEINLINVGVNGNTTADMLDRFHEHVLDYRPKAVLIMGGGNDVMGGTQLEFVYNNLAMMAEFALQRGIIPMMGIQPEPDHSRVPTELKTLIDYEQVKQNLAMLKSWILTFAEANNLPVIDFDTHMKSRLRAGYGRFFFDGIHPNPSGHQIMAQIAKDAFIEMGILERKAAPVDHRFDL